MPGEVCVENASEEPCPSSSEFDRWVSAALASVPEGPQDDWIVSIRVVGEAEGADLNSTYRNKPHATNVLSFPAEFDLPDPLPLLGDLAICAPVVKREANEQHKTETAHWAHMVVHGTLHLLGYDHIDNKEAEQMEALETAILDRLGFPSPYQE